MMIKITLTLIALPLAPAADADDIVWTNLGGDSLWSNPNNWFDNDTLSTGLPTSADTVASLDARTRVPSTALPSCALIPSFRPTRHGTRGCGGRSLE